MRNKNAHNCGRLAGIQGEPFTANPHPLTARAAYGAWYLGWKIGAELRQEVILTLEDPNGQRAKYKLGRQVEEFSSHYGEDDERKQEEA